MCSGTIKWHKSSCATHILQFTKTWLLVTRLSFISYLLWLHTCHSSPGSCVVIKLCLSRQGWWCHLRRGRCGGKMFFGFSRRRLFLIPPGQSDVVGGHHCTIMHFSKNSSNDDLIVYIRPILFRFYF